MLRKFLSLLDGTSKSRGQSVVELALVAPFLIILIAGMAEIGWFANNYMTLVEVTRMGARTASGLQGNFNPNYWEIPDNGLVQASTVPDPSSSLYSTWLLKYRNCDPTDPNAAIGFYNFIGCAMLQSMNPLRITGFEPNTNDPDTGKPYADDMVISAFAVQMVDPSRLPENLRKRIQWPIADAMGQPQGIVVARYPSNTNECNVAATRDPFDYMKDNNFSWFNWNNRRYDLELSGYDSNPNEHQLGFVWNNQYIDKWGCIGSEFSIEDVERLINLDKFDLKQIDMTTPYQDQRDYLPSQGIVLVEIHWKHETLSQFVGLAPIISPVFSILGVNTEVSVWAVFPLPQIEPRIEYPPKGTF